MGYHWRKPLERRCNFPLNWGKVTHGHLGARNIDPPPNVNPLFVAGWFLVVLKWSQKNNHLFISPHKPPYFKAHSDSQMRCTPGEWRGPPVQGTQEASRWGCCKTRAASPGPIPRPGPRGRCLPNEVPSEQRVGASSSRRVDLDPPYVPGKHQPEKQTGLRIGIHVRSCCWRERRDLIRQRCFSLENLLVRMLCLDYSNDL